MVLHLDPKFRPQYTVNEVKFESFTFAGGEPHIKILTDLSEVFQLTITHRIRSFNDFGLLLLAIDAVKRAGVKHIEVFIPYFPGARQDRLMVAGEPLSAKVYADLLNAQGLGGVTVYDPHSEVTPAVLDQCKTLSNIEFIEDVISDIVEELVLLAPDGGALKKVYQLSKALGGIPVVECSKSRDVKTGKITNFKVYEEDLKGKSCVIVDDICDGGGTFLGLAKELKSKQAGNLYLAVSHGIFSKGLEELQQWFTKIYCTDSFKTYENSTQLRQFKLKAF